MQNLHLYPPCRRCVNCHKPYCGLKSHIANFLVVQTCCDIRKTITWSHDATCGNCGDHCKKCSKKDHQGGYVPLCPNGVCGLHEKILSGVDTVKNFCVWLLQPIHKHCIAIAHNSKGFDAHMILSYCMENSIQPANIIYQRSKIMKMRINHGIGITFINSLSSLPMALKKLPKALGLNAE